MNTKFLKAAAVTLITAAALGIAGCGEQTPPQKYEALLQDANKQVEIIDTKYKELENQDMFNKLYADRKETLKKTGGVKDAVSPENAKIMADAYNATKPAADKLQQDRETIKTLVNANAAKYPELVTRYSKDIDKIIDAESHHRDMKDQTTRGDDMGYGELFK